MEVIKIYNENGILKEYPVNLHITDFEEPTLWYCKKPDCKMSNEILWDDVCESCEFLTKCNEKITEESIKPTFDIKLIKWKITDISKLVCDDLYKLNYLWYTLNEQYEDDYYNKRNSQNEIEFTPNFNYKPYILYNEWYYHEKIFVDFINKVQNGQQIFKFHKDNVNYDYEIVVMIYEFILEKVFKYNYKKYNKIDKELVRQDGFRYSHLGKNRFILNNEYDVNCLLPNSNRNIDYNIYSRTNINYINYVIDYGNVPLNFKENIIDHLYFDEATIPIANYPITFTYYEIVNS